MTQKLKQYFLGYLLYFPCSFLIWINIVKSVQLGEVLSNCTSNALHVVKVRVCAKGK